MIDVREILSKIKPYVLGWIADYLSAQGYAQKWVHLQHPATSTSFDGDAFSSVGKTGIILSTSFGLPATVKAVYATVSCSDSASGGTPNLYFLLSGNSSTGSGTVVCRPSGLPNSYINTTSGEVKCDENGNIYYEVAASGSGTLNVWVQISAYLE